VKNDILAQLGLNNHQSLAYRYLLSSGPSPPPKLAKQLKLTRSNAYKVLDSLVELGLVSRTEIDKKLVYKAEDPIALASLVAEERNRVRQLEGNVKNALSDLRKTYQKGAAVSEIQNFPGAEAVKSLYKHQSELQKPIYFIKTRSDIPIMGYETMDQIRRMSIKYGTPRFGIVPDAPEAAIDPKIDQELNLTKTWIDSQSYTAPVEWTVSGDELVMIYGDNTSGIRIKNSAVADAFIQLWHVLDQGLRADPEYKKMPKKARRRA
jgi:sugar-specific transcriptional regulator TrmB